MIVTDPRYLGTQWQQTLNVSETTLPAIREAVEQWVGGWGFSRDSAHSAALVMNELATNAIVHADMLDVWFRIRREGMFVCLAVWDTSPKDPHRCHAGDYAESGRGFEVVEYLADEWGVTRLGRGKWTWAKILCRTPDHAWTPAGTPRTAPQPERG